MRRGLLNLLACPACGALLEIESAESEDGEHLLEGELRCQGCSASWPVAHGVPRLNHRMEGLENVQRSFGYEWRSHHQGRLEHGTVFGRTPEEDWQYFLEGIGRREGDVAGLTVLDAGCGSGTLTRLIAEHGAGTVVGLDINDAVDEAFERTRSEPNVHIIQGNVATPPLRRGAFDVVWCNGVLHHTPDAARSYDGVAPLAAPGGVMYVWVYPKRFNPFRFVKDAADAARLTRLSPPALLGVSKAISYPSLALLGGYRAVRSLPGLGPRTAWGRRTVRPRSLREVQLTWLDALSPEFDSRHTEAEVVAWFERAGFERIQTLEEPKVGVRGVASPARPPS